VSTFTAAGAGALPGPGWLQGRRRAAWDRFTATPLPTEAEEVWRYSRVSELDLDEYAPVTGGAPAKIPAAVEPAIAAVGDLAGLLVLVNGRLVHTALDPVVASRGVVVGDLAARADDPDPGDDVVPVDAFTDLNEAYADSIALVRVPAGVVVERPLGIVHYVDADASATFPRVLVELGADAEATVLDYATSSDVDALTVPVTELEVGDAARLRYLNVQMLGPRVWQVGYQRSRAGRDANLQAASVALGGYYARLRQDSQLVGKGGSSQLLALYYGDAHQMHDFRTMQDHVAPNTTSDLLFKGAVDDTARSVYSGLIRVRKEARGTNAMQTNRNLVLAEGASAESVPNLEIETNDVKCAHASAVGPIDEDQRYYLESRGVPPEIAERLIVAGFFDEVLDRLPVPAVHGALHGAIRTKMLRRFGS
jgi:Fe-S cluster assembly protein SufD